MQILDSILVLILIVTIVLLVLAMVKPKVKRFRLRSPIETVKPKKKRHVKKAATKKKSKGIEIRWM